MTPLMIVTDLDGSLLDHYTYSFAAALPVLRQLQARDIPVVLCSSKTRAEMQSLREQLDLLECPYIVENGAAVYVPKSRYPNLTFDTELAPADGAPPEWRKLFGSDRAYWQTLLDDLPDRFHGHFRRLSHMSIGQITDITGLSPDDARRAALREFGEPIQWRGSDTLKADFIRELEQQGATVLQGGRFLHVVGSWNKGRALTWLAESINGSVAQAPTTISLGDSHNDLAMLEAADYAIVIKSPVHDAPQLKRKQGVIYTQATGPKGWAEGLSALLDQPGHLEASNG